MRRDAIEYLEKWKGKTNRKPLILRGARQVGKSYLVKDFGLGFERFVEINFEIEPSLAALFDKNLDPHRIIRDLTLATGEQIVPGRTLLFFDEIQECPAAIIALRYFHEKLPELHVMAAGSLIDFAIDQVGVPVGRVSFLHLYPLSFIEFLTASGNENLRETIEYEHDPGEELSSPIHDKLLGLLGEYIAVGGMPEAVAAWIETADLAACTEIHRSLINTYREDFAKYSRRNQSEHVEMVFKAIPRLIGRKFVYHSVSPDVRSRALRPALDLLSKAQVAHIVHHSSANAVPFGAEMNPRLFKVLFLDIALAQTILGMDLGKWILDPAATIANRGAITEAFVGQEMLAYSEATSRSELYYWFREKRGSLAEVDYVSAVGGEVVPVEVKSKTPGSARSLNLFLAHKENCNTGVIFSARNYHMDDQMRIRQYPLYAIARALFRAHGASE